jgi:LPS-assembly lipoprotein
MVVFITGCGFKLRGAINLPDEIQKIYVVGPRGSNLVKDLKEMLAYSAQVVNKRADADAVLSVDKEESDNRTLSVDSRGKVRESEMQYSVIYSFVKSNGEVLIDKDALLLSRDYIDDENDVIGRTNESVVIQRDLKRDAAQQILRRIQALKISDS